MCISVKKLFCISTILLALFPDFFDISEQINPRVLIVSFDGFKFNGIDKYSLKFLQALRKNGTHTAYMQNVYETKTFPNHHSVATGFLPASHGVLNQALYDPLYKRVLLYSPELWNYNNDIVPIWIHNEQSGHGRYSGVYMWPGSEFHFDGKLPTFVEKYNRSIPWIKRVNTITSWFLHPSTPANLIMMYFEEPDFHSHRYGPQSPQVKDQMKKIDLIINYLVNSLTLNKILNINIFLVSDHGMSSVPAENIINITNLFTSPEDCIVTGSSPTLHIIPQKKTVNEVYNFLKNYSSGKQFKVYKKNELPERWLYRDNRRIPPLMIIANEGYGFDDVRRYIPDTPTYGLHGYDNQLEDMRAFFLAVGPRIKRNHKINTFSTVDLFSVFCEVLEINKLPTNGSFSNVKDLLLPPFRLGNTSDSNSTAIVLGDSTDNQRTDIALHISIDHNITTLELGNKTDHNSTTKVLGNRAARKNNATELDKSTVSNNVTEFDKRTDDKEDR